MAHLERTFYQTVIVALLSSLRSDEGGQGMVEYTLILAAVALVALAGFQLLGGNISNQINTVAGAF